MTKPLHTGFSDAALPLQLATRSLEVVHRDKTHRWHPDKLKRLFAYYGLAERKIRPFGAYQEIRFITPRGHKVFLIR